MRNTGINETNARKSGLDVDTVILSPMSHAGYYPGKIGCSHKNYVHILPP